MRIFKIFVMVSTIVATVLGMTGCAIKPQMSTSYGPERIIKNDTIGKLIIVEGAETWRSPSDGYNKSTRNIHVLQNAADATLNEGYKFFAFARPYALSNLNSATMINTAEEFIDKCTTSSASVLTMGNERCGFVGGATTMASAIFAFKNQPKTFLTYNAQEVKDYLIKNEKYRQDSYEKVDRLRAYTENQLQDLPTLIRTGH